jgi:AcrR family transcriptional regulator
MRQRAREAAGSALLEAAEDVAARRGIEAASIAAIAERAGVAVGTLYNYFPDRDALFAALFKMRRAEIMPRITGAIEQVRELPFEQALRTYLTALFTVFEEYRGFCKVAMSAEHSAAIRGKGPSAVLTSIVQALTELLQPVTGAATADAAFMMFGAVKAMLHRRIESGEPLPPAASLLADTFLKGLLPR